tara:strand:- start:56 stop:409 length:354 start_codon:yes stop_codon:yes gene_type:complete
MKINSDYNKRKNKKLRGGSNNTILIIFLIFSISIIFGLIINNMYKKNNSNIKISTINNHGLVNSVSSFLKNLAISNKLINENILKNIKNKIKLDNINNEKFIIDNYLYIKFHIDYFE